MPPNKPRLARGLAEVALLITLSVVVYELEQGKPPSNVTDLVPAYLRAMAVDPASGTNMNYLPLLPSRP